MNISKTNQQPIFNGTYINRWGDWEEVTKKGMIQIVKPKVVKNGYENAKTKETLIINSKNAYIKLKCHDLINYDVNNLKIILTKEEAKSYKKLQDPAKIINFFNKLLKNLFKFDDMNIEKVDIKDLFD